MLLINSIVNSKKDIISLHVFHCQALLVWPNIGDDISIKRANIKLSINDVCNLIKRVKQAF